MDEGWGTRRALEARGFVGFVAVADLRRDSALIPDVRGVYMVLRAHPGPAAFVATGTGGRFKGKDPNVDVELLGTHWVPGSEVLYIGKAGDPGSTSNLRKRLRQYLRFGAGANVGHWGGRYIWQLDDAEDLVFCWKPLPDGAPSALESELIEEFRARYGKRPFANLVK